MGEISDRSGWEKAAKATPAIPSASGELAWIEARLKQVELSQDFMSYEVVRLVASSKLSKRLQNQYQEDDLFRRRWQGTEFVFMPSYWEIPGDDDHWYALAIQTRDMEFLELNGVAYPTPMPESHIELRWTFWMDGMSPSESEEAARKLKD